jgi:hypothetical protein
MFSNFFPRNIMLEVRLFLLIANDIIPHNFNLIFSDLYFAKLEGGGGGGGGCCRDKNEEGQSEKYKKVEPISQRQALDLKTPKQSRLSRGLFYF